MIAKDHSGSDVVQALSDQPRNPPVIAITRNDENDNHPPIPEALPILPLRNTVIFPGTVVPLTVGRASSRKLLEESLPQSKLIGLATQRNPEVDNAVS